ncbi:MAG: RnfABCDGE type electron transport complex subunit D [Clostridia bacterium]|nr:RnfABCDGE type electron transport complex subunit D [Clostridia bacterium]
MEDLLFVSSSPHIRHKDTTSKIMFNVIAALIPAVIAGVYFFGFRTLLLEVYSMLAAALFEALYCFFAKKKLTVWDGSAMLTGLLLALCSPPTLPLWAITVGDLFAVIVVKQFFGGLGHNFVNPALAARAFMLAAWPVFMTTWSDPKVDAISSATPLAGGAVTTLDAFLGNVPGCVGEVSALAILIGGIYLLARKIIKPYIPLAYILTVFVFFSIAGKDGLQQILLGGVFLAAFFMATDYVTIPVTAKGQIIMGIGCGLLTSIIRLGNGYPEGVTYAVLLMNAATPLIDKFTVPKKYGEVKHA